MLTITHHTEKGYIEVILEGELTYKSFEEMITEINDFYPGGTIKVLQFYKNAHFNISIMDVTKLVKLTKNLLKTYDLVKTASVISTAKEMAWNMLYGGSMQSKHFKQKNFSTQQAALYWLLN